MDLVTKQNLSKELCLGKKKLTLGTKQTKRRNLLLVVKGKPVGKGEGARNNQDSQQLTEEKLGRESVQDLVIWSTNDSGSLLLRL